LASFSAVHLHHSEWPKELALLEHRSDGRPDDIGEDSIRDGVVSLVQ
jgi:hypothetical protein